MDKDAIEEALAALKEYSCIDLYESLIKIVITNDLDSLDEHEYDIAGDRMDVLNTLIKADQLSDWQMSRIAKVDRFILNTDVPQELEPLKVWLKRNALAVKNDSSSSGYSLVWQRSSYIPRAPTCGSYSKKDIEYFTRRNEVFLNIWENAQLKDLQTYRERDFRSLATVRSALQRVYWGHHFSEGQLFRLLHADLRFYLDADAHLIAPEYLTLITELLEEYELQHFFVDQRVYTEVLDTPTEANIKNYLNRWDWFSETWENEEIGINETRQAISYRWKLHCFYRRDLLSPRSLTELVGLDKAALLSPNWTFLNRFERRFISEFLFEQGAFDPQLDQFNPATAHQNRYLKPTEK